VPSIKIKNVSSDVHRVLHWKAADAGQSLQEYLLAQLTRHAREETLDEVFDCAGERAGGSVGLGFSAETLRADRKRAV
jgi:hypothetical protein